MPRRLLTVAAAVAVTAVLTACDQQVSGGSGAAPEDGATSKSMITELCRAAEAASEGDVAGAGAGFADVHGSLHELAAQLGSEDDGHRRTVAARLLEAKQRVEADLEAGAEPGAGAVDLAGDLRTLAGVVADATAESAPDAESCG